MSLVLNILYNGNACKKKIITGKYSISYIVKNAFSFKQWRNGKVYKCGCVIKYLKGRKSGTRDIRRGTDNKKGYGTEEAEQQRRKD
jgi:hypothetical protein